MSTVSKVITFCRSSSSEDISDLIQSVFTTAKQVPNDWGLHWLCSAGDSEFYVVSEYHNPTKEEVIEVMTKQDYDPDIIDMVVLNTDWNK